MLKRLSCKSFVLRAISPVTDLTASLAKMQTQGDSKLAEWQTAARRGSLAADLAPAYAKEKGQIVL
jgi:hypothetical protein